jgi:hypothetical protein
VTARQRPRIKKTERFGFRQIRDHPKWFYRWGPLHFSTARRETLGSPTYPAGP